MGRKFGAAKNVKAVMVRRPKVSGPRDVASTAWRFAVMMMWCVGSIVPFVDILLAEYLHDCLRVRQDWAIRKATSPSGKIE